MAEIDGVFFITQSPRPIRVHSLCRGNHVLIPLTTSSAVAPGRIDRYPNWNQIERIFDRSALLTIGIARDLSVTSFSGIQFLTGGFLIF